MIALYDFIPGYCPNCGKRLVWIDSTSEKAGIDVTDYLDHCCFVCDCGVHSQKAATDRLRRTATVSGGDLAKYLD